jgi:hypothetical protein
MGMVFPSTASLISESRIPELSFFNPPFVNHFFLSLNNFCFGINEEGEETPELAYRRNVNVYRNFRSLELSQVEAIPYSSLNHKTGVDKSSPSLTSPKFNFKE